MALVVDQVFEGDGNAGKGAGVCAVSRSPVELGGALEGSQVIDLCEGVQGRLGGMSLAKGLLDPGDS